MKYGVYLQGGLYLDVAFNTGLTVVINVGVIKPDCSNASNSSVVLIKTHCNERLHYFDSLLYTSIHYMLYCIGEL